MGAVPLGVHVVDRGETAGEGEVETGVEGVIFRVAFIVSGLGRGHLAHDGDEVGHASGFQTRQRHRNDFGTAFGQRFNRGAPRLHHRVVSVVKPRVEDAEGDPLEVETGDVVQVDGRTLKRVDVVFVFPRKHPIHDRAIAGAVCDGSEVGHRPTQFVGPMFADARPGGFDSDDATQGRGDANASAAISPECDRGQPRGHRRGTSRR